MTALTMTELRKLSTVRITWVLSAIGLALMALSSRFYIFAPGLDAPAGSAERTTTAISIIGANTAIVLVVGVLVTTTEFRHATIGHTLQLTPSRTRVLTAKLAAGGIYGALFYLAAVLLVAGLLAIATLGQGVSLEWDAAIGTALGGNLLAMTLTATLGVAIGALVRSQVAAITGSLVWMFIVENLAAAFDYRIGRWLPFQALNAIFATDDVSPDPGAIAPLAGELGLTVFLAYVLLATLAAWVLMAERDVRRVRACSRNARPLQPTRDSSMFPNPHPPRVRVLLAVVLAVALSGCVNPASDRLAELPVLTTVPDGVEVIERRSGTEIGGWPTTGPQAQVSYRVIEGDPDAVLEQIRQIALDTGWDLDPAGYLRGSLQTDDGLAQFSAFNPSTTDEVIVSVWR